MWHHTNSDNIHNIAKEGFKTKYAGTNTEEPCYGKGLYFSTNIKPGFNELILSRVIVGKLYDYGVNINKKLIEIFEGYDSIVAGKENNRMYVVYSDYMALPVYRIRISQSLF